MPCTANTVFTGPRDTAGLKAKEKVVTSARPHKAIERVQG